MPVETIVIDGTSILMKPIGLTRLLGSVRIAGVPFHVEATVPSECGSDGEWCSAVQDLLGDGESPMTVNIAGRDYVLAIFPFAV